MKKYAFILSLFLLVGCKSAQPDFVQTASSHVKKLLIDGHYSMAQLAYVDAKNEGTLEANFISRYDQFFQVISLYDYEYIRAPKPPYRYASCADLTLHGDEVIEWRSIAAKANPFHLSSDRVKEAQQELTSLNLWSGPINGIATAEFQKAVIFYRFLYGMNVECILYPYDLMLKSTYCSLFPSSQRCQQGYEF